MYAAPSLSRRFAITLRGATLAIGLLALACSDRDPVGPVEPVSVGPAFIVVGPVAQVSAGVEHTCALASDGSVQCWGNNGNGQATTPAGSFTQVSAGSAHTCALASNGSVQCWGFNGLGQASPPAGIFIQVSAGWDHTCALASDGSVQCWGGKADIPPAGTFTQVSAGNGYTCAVASDESVQCWGRDDFGQASPPAGSFTQVSAGNLHTCALTSGDGSVQCWGFNNSGQASPPDASFTQVSVGSAHTCALASDRSVQCWGDNGSGQASPPTSIFTQVSAGQIHNCALAGDGSIECWGSDGSGQASLPTGSFTRVSPGEFHTCGLASDGSVQCWGNNSFGQASPPTGIFTQVSAGQIHNCALAGDGSIHCWGSHGSKLDYGQASPPAGSFTQVSAGNLHTCALTSDDRSVQCWGDNSVSQASPPTGSFTHISAGSSHTCALSTDGSVLCWGHNNFGQASPPTGSFVRLEANFDQTCAGRLDGTFQCWGRLVSTSYVGSSGGLTPPGTDVSVTPIDQTTGVPSPATITFDEVLGAGETNVQSGTMGGNGAPVSPSTADFKLGEPPTYYEITTTASFSGSVTVCIDYSGTSYGNESELELLHQEVGDWVPITDPGFPDTQKKIICGTTTSLSPFLVAETNVAPLVTSITLPGGPVALNTAVALSASFTDGNPTDVHTATIDWETITTGGSVSESDGAGTVSGSHTYGAPGVYTIGITVSDGGKTGSRSSALDVPAYIVVYDPSAGFVTGGGWIDSPMGACMWSGCASDGGTIGKATFGFVSRYKKGANVPDGNAEFLFKAGGLHFKSTSYEWLVIAGARAQFKGEGAINGAGSYGFLITAVDAAVSGGGDHDAFRIKIWDSATDAVVYDNEMGEAEDGNAAAALGGGSIVIHRK